MKKQRYFSLNTAAVVLLCLISGFKTSAQTYQWKSLPMGAGGFVSGIITSKQEQNLMYARTDVGGAYKWNAATGSWTPLQDWSSVTQSGFYSVESIAIDPHATNKLYMLVGISYFDNGKTAILKSDDYGQTFTTIDVSTQFKTHGNGMGRSNGERLQVDPNLGSTLYVGTRYNGLWKSTDAGLTWSRLAGLNVNTTPNGNGISFVLIDPASGTDGVASGIIYAGVSRFNNTGDNVYKSIDGGTTFNPVSGGPAAYMPQRANLTAAGDMIINYANGSGPYGTTDEPMNNGGIWKYNTISGTWTNITPSGIARAWGGLSVDPNNPNRIIASTINNYQLQYGSAYGDRIYYTTNSGASWTDVVARGFSLNANGIPWITGQAIHWAGSVEFDPFNSSRVFITSGNGVFSNEQIEVASTQWKFDVKGLEELVPRDMVSIPGGSLFTVVSDYDGFKHTDINQYGQRLTPTMGTTTGIASAGSNPNVLVRVGSRMYYTANQGTAWTQTGTVMGTEGKVAVSADGTTFLHCPNNSSVTYHSRNNGTSWTAANGLTLSNSIPVADPVNPDKFYVYNSSNGAFNVSNDGGASFATTINIGTGGSRIIRTVPEQEGHIWVAMYNGGLRRSVNSGSSFTTISSVQRCSAIGLGKAAPGAAYFTLYMWGTVGGVTGIFRSTDEGATWVRLNDDANQFGGPGNGQFVIGDMNTYGLVYMSTVGRGVIAGQEAAALPVSLSGFTVREIKRNSRRLAQLSWKTASESNAGYFTIERSTDAGSWISVYSVPSKALNGNSSSILEYDYADDVTGMNGVVYYRLKMVDNDGSSAYSSTGSVRLGNGVSKFSIVLSPNPVVAKQNPTVRITSDKVQKVVLRIIAPDGTIRYTKAISLAIGSTGFHLPEAANYPSGLYALEAVSAETGRSVGVVRFVIR